MTDLTLFIPKGFSAAACSSGIKKSGKLDMALIVADNPITCAGVFTKNKVVAAPVKLTKSRVQQGLCQAILVNSGNANACTGDQGLRDAKLSADLVGEALDIAPEFVAVSSTGVIGAPLPMHCFETYIPSLASSLGTDQFDGVAKAMMTTDAFPKLSSRSLDIGGKEVRILGLAKGAGMIHPDMATMLAFILTDAKVSDNIAENLLKETVDETFNRITVDRDTSTNDTVLFLASGEANNVEIENRSEAHDNFSRALKDIMLDLAKMIVRDGEGATKLVRVQVQGAVNKDEALLIAKSVATSPLVKTAFFGQDPNWGRILAAVGYSGAEVDPDQVSIQFEHVSVVEHGVGLGLEQENLAFEILKKPEFTVTIDLGLGEGNAYYYTSDLSFDYVKINAEYRT